jgi:hypothetical protein
MKLLLVTIPLLTLLTSCGPSCKEVGSKKDATPDEVRWYAENCMNR